MRWSDPRAPHYSSVPRLQWPQGHRCAAMPCSDIEQLLIEDMEGHIVMPRRVGHTAAPAPCQPLSR